MKIAEVISFLEKIAHPSLQEDYDNSGLITGSYEQECSGILVSLDAIEDVIEEAITRNCNLVVAHHPIIFRGLKKINGKNYVERTVIKALKNDVAIYAIHTNLDNVIEGVSGRMAKQLGLKNISILFPGKSGLKKLYTFVPASHEQQVRDALFAAGAGEIGNYSECSFNSSGTGTFKAGERAKPFVGKENERHYEQETRIEVVFPSYLETKLIRALRSSHPYEEPAFDVLSLTNSHKEHGAGVVGELAEPMSASEFLSFVKKKFDLKIIRHTQFPKEMISKVALCGGAGNFLIPSALSARVDVYLTGDLKYHEFFDADGKIALLDIGHFESEQFTIDLLHELLAEKFPTFAVLKTSVQTNPVRYFGIDEGNS